MMRFRGMLTEPESTIMLVVLLGWTISHLFLAVCCWTSCWRISSGETEVAAKGVVTVSVCTVCIPTKRTNDVKWPECAWN